MAILVNLATVVIIVISVNYPAMPHFPPVFPRKMRFSLSETFRIKPKRVTTSVRAEYTAWRFVKVYLDVAPYSPFKSGTGPQFGTVSFGGGLRF